MVKKLLDYILSLPYFIYFVLVVLIFHPIQWLAFNLFGNRFHQKVVHVMNGAFVYGMVLNGSIMRFFNNQKLPTDKKYLIVANHQSMFDIIGIIWFLRKLNPIFVSKKSLAKGIPSISYNLQKSGAALIDRKDRNQATQELKRMSKHSEKYGFTPVIFPEGTRSPNSLVRRFNTTGISTIIENMNIDYILPVLVRNTGKFNPKGFYPFSSFTLMNFEIMPKIKPAADLKKQVKELEQSFRNVLNG